MRIEYGKSEFGFEFPMYQGKLLSWTLASTLEDESEGFPRLRVVINAMRERRPEQIAYERADLLKGSFDRIFGNNATRVLRVLDEELSKHTGDDSDDRSDLDELLRTASENQKGQ